MENAKSATDAILENARQRILALEIRFASDLYSFCEEEATHFLDITGREVFDESLRREWHSDVGGLYRNILRAVIENARHLMEHDIIRNSSELAIHIEAVAPLLGQFAPGRDVKRDFMIEARQSGLYEGVKGSRGVRSETAAALSSVA